MARTMTHRKHALWYVRREQKARGPYPPGQIVREALLGRIRHDDELSLDGEQWQPLSALPEFQPDHVYQTHTPEGQSKLLRARLHEDERQHDRRGSGASSGQGRRRQDRRKKEPEEAVRLRQRKQRWVAARGKNVLHTRSFVPALAFVVFALIVYFVIYRPVPVTGERDCAASPTSGVNWSGCRLSGKLLMNANLREARIDNAQLRRAHLQEANLSRADLRYTDLEGALLQQAVLKEANLTGAVLRGAALMRADLRHADLRFANLVNANLDRAALSGARLDKAVWTDGRICAPNSVGSCQ